MLRALTVLCCLVLVGTASRGLAQQICGVALSACDLQSDEACLERHYACGEYDTIIAALAAEDFAPTPDQKYFLGASYHGRYIRERSFGRQCEMAAMARETLEGYLSGLDLEFARTGSFGSVRQMDRLHHAGQALADLGAVSGCPESALTRARIEAAARAEATAYVRAVFLSPPAEARAAFATLQLALRGFVSRASDLETGIALRRIEIESARATLARIRETLGEVLGPVAGSGAAVVVDASVLDGLVARTAAMRRGVVAREDAFRAALGGVSAEEYAAIRARTIAEAERFLRVSAFHLNMAGRLLPTDPAAPFWRLDAALAAPSAARAAADDLATIRADWRAHGAATGLCAQPGAAARVWYCR